MWPTLLKIGSFEITTFGLMMFLGFLTGAFLLAKEFRRRGMDEDIASSIVLAGAVGGILGAKVYYSILYGDWSLLFSRSGLVWYGGMIGGWLLASIVVLRKRIPYLLASDAGVAPLAAGYSLGRIGCFLVGDDYGRPTNAWFGVAFPKGAPPTTADSLRSFGVRIDPAIPADTLLRVHPTQIYEAIAAAVIFFILWSISKREHHRGFLTGLFLILAGIERFLVEIVRAKDDRFLGPFTVAQLISTILVIVGTALVAYSRRQPVVHPAKA